MMIKKLVVFGDDDFSDPERILADMRALLPFGLRHVAGCSVRQSHGARAANVPYYADGMIECHLFRDALQRLGKVPTDIRIEGSYACGHICDRCGGGVP